MSTAVVKSEQRSEIVEFMPALSIQQIRARFDAITQCMKEVMRVGNDYGVIPGATKPTLLKPGAEKLCTFFGLTVPEPVIVEKIQDWTGKEYGEPFFYYMVRQDLLRHGEVVASQFASCNSWETKYRYRQGERTCPSCKQPAIIKGKAEYGGGWVCFKKRGGCNAKFRDGDQTIESQQVGRVPNKDIADQVNTILKMAEKRALVAATLIAVNASEFFTQDLEDTVVVDGDSRPVENGNGHSPSEEELNIAMQEDAAHLRRMAERAEREQKQQKEAGSITPEQATQLDQELKDAGFVGDRFTKLCEWAAQTYHCSPDLKEFPALHFNDLLARIRRKSANQQRAEPATV